MQNLLCEKLEKELEDQEQDHDTCIICYLSEPKKMLFNLQDCCEYSKDVCKHKFHVSCLKTDIQFNFKRAKHYTCPYCDKKFLKKKVLDYVDNFMKEKSLRAIGYYKLIDLQKIAEEYKITIKMEKKCGKGMKNKTKKILYDEIIEFKNNNTI